MCGGPGSLLKLGAPPLDQSLFIDTQLGVGDSGLWYTLLESYKCFYNYHVNSMCSVFVIVSPILHLHGLKFSVATTDFSHLEACCTLKITDLQAQ